MQALLASLTCKQREAVEEASVGDLQASERAKSLAQLLATEEPRLRSLFEEKRQRYALDVGRLKELKREVMELEHAEKKLESKAKEASLEGEDEEGMKA